MRETSESICEEKKTVTDTRTNERRAFWVSKGKRHRYRCIPRPRGVSRAAAAAAAAAALVSSRTERSRTLPAFAFAGGRKTTTTSSRSKGWCFDPCMIRVLDTHSSVKKSHSPRSESGGGGVVTGGKKTFVDRVVVDDASRSDAMIYIYMCVCVSSNSTTQRTHAT